MAYLPTPLRRRKKGHRARHTVYRGIGELQADLDAWTAEYNGRRPHQGRWCYRRTPMQTFLDAALLAREKIMRH